MYQAYLYLKICLIHVACTCQIFSKRLQKAGAKKPESLHSFYPLCCPNRLSCPFSTSAGELWFDTSGSYNQSNDVSGILQNSNQMASSVSSINFLHRSDAHPSPDMDTPAAQRGKEVSHGTWSALLRSVDIHLYAALITGL